MGNAKMKKYLYITLVLICSVLILNHCTSHSRRIGNTRFYLVETMADSKEGKPLAGLYYKPTAISGYHGENTTGFPKTILWNDHYIISKNFDGDSPEIVEYVIINIDSINPDNGEMKEIHRFRDRQSYINYLKHIKLSEADMKQTGNHVAWLDGLF